MVTPVVNRNRDYDPAKAFAPVAKLTQNYQVLVVHPDFPAKSVQELVAYAKANPGKLNFGSRRPRQRQPSRRRAVQAQDRHRHRARALQGRGRGRDRA